MNPLPTDEMAVYLSRSTTLLATLNRMHVQSGTSRLCGFRISSALQEKVSSRTASHSSEASASDIIPSQQRPGETFLHKQSRLHRPMSPWMNYNWQITNSMSIANRITGAAMGGAIAIVAVATMVGSYSFVDYMEIVRSWPIPDPVIYTLKLAVAFTFTFHFFNSLRHIAWDVGKGFDLSTTYKSGYSAMIAAAVVAIALTFFVKPEYRKRSLVEKLTTTSK